MYKYNNLLIGNKNTRVLINLPNLKIRLNFEFYLKYLYYWANFMAKRKLLHKKGISFQIL